MARMRIDSFVGLAPRVPGRAMGQVAAQEHKNLLATANEFRPLQGDKDIQAAPSGALTLHRMTRDASGKLHTGDSDGWIADAADKNYVRGQLNDDATERTAVSWNDGTQQPRVIDAKGADRLLGVPPPASISVTLNQMAQFTREDAQAWLDSDVWTDDEGNEFPGFAQQVAEALKASLHLSPTTSRWDNGKPVAGATESHSLTPGTGGSGNFDLWYAYMRISDSDATKRGLKDPVLSGRTISGQWAVAIELMPYWGRVKDKSALAGRLMAIESPKDGQALFTQSQADALADRLAALFDPDGPSIAAQRAAMDKAAKDFIKAMNTNPGAVPGAPSSKPTKPTKPTVPEWIYDEFGDSDRRLKTGIERVGVHEQTGLPLYEFAYKDIPGRRWRGVMSDDVKTKYPEAVRTGPDGYEQVNYNMLGIELEMIK